MGERHYDIFLEGELVDLVVPNEHAIHADGWYRWFNDPAINANLRQGGLPNTPHLQVEYLRELQRSKTRFALLIKPKLEDFVIGVTSLSGISHETRQADIAMVIGRRLPDFRGVFAGLEAKCLMTEHAFETLGLERINSGQSARLKDWQRSQILFGYKVEGIRRKAFRKGRRVHDVIVSGCLLEDYLVLKEQRGGRLWPGSGKLIELIRALPRTSLEEKVSKALAELVDEHYGTIRQA
jgi:RimJ/RimL family protein N-acetyltransferase